MGNVVPFEFMQCSSILKFTGERARNLRDLREIITRISDGSIFHHTHQYFYKGHTNQYTNDFAQWAGEALEEEILSEHLSSVDPYDFRTVNELRMELVSVIDRYLESFPEPREAMSGSEFHFNETVTFVFPVGIRVRNLAEFLMAIKYIDAGSVYYHFYEARRRLGWGMDDFSMWIEDSLGKKELGEKIRLIDPFMHNIEEIRGHLIKLVENQAQSDMEVL